MPSRADGPELLREARGYGPEQRQLEPSRHLAEADPGSSGVIRSAPQTNSRSSSQRRATCGYSKNPSCRSGRRERPPFAKRSQPPCARPRPSKRSSTASTRHSSSIARSTSTGTTAPPRSCARSSRSLGSTVTQASSMNSTWKASSRSLERVLPRAADLWVQASLEQRQRFQQLFFPDGIAFDGIRFVRTGVTAGYVQLLAGNRDRK